MVCSRRWRSYANRRVRPTGEADDVAQKAFPLWPSRSGARTPGNVVLYNGPAERGVREGRSATLSRRRTGCRRERPSSRRARREDDPSSVPLGRLLEARSGVSLREHAATRREAVERLFREGEVRYLVCTSTLLEGVNLPCQNLFVRAPRKGNNNLMSASDFWNLAAGRGDGASSSKATSSVLTPTQTEIGWRCRHGGRVSQWRERPTPSRKNMTRFAAHRGRHTG